MLWLLGLPLALVAAAFLCWQLRYPTHSLRYAVIVELETSDGLVDGSSVVEMKIREKPGFGSDAPGISYHLQGEAVAVDLPDGRTLFALLRRVHWEEKSALTILALARKNVVLRCSWCFLATC